ncbi:hypothetical protein MWU49_04045 [Alcanivorax sp. S6407]|uniref:hypothetical protein n=1 Tax=Alcanivorax sp. S6407 TaxID=2926424 RepID=UPI001FF58009|nr:hypothetical protein [Alcanivorax sp. S6407]MCK0152862.1 hypothetical protein [Alcanivorax sp. S6407]
MCKRSNRARRTLLTSLLLVTVPWVQASPFSARLSLTGTTAYAQPGDLGYVDEDQRSLSADQQTARLMADPVTRFGDFSAHLRLVRLHRDNFPLTEPGVSQFRWRDLSSDWLNETTGNQQTRAGHEIDRLSWRYMTDLFAVTAGRQPIDWGTGRLWQPHNVFGAFAPTDLDTEFKPGVDALLVETWPSDFSSLAFAAVAAPQHSDQRDSGAGYYRGQIGEQSELLLLAATVDRDQILGAGWESAWGGMGWRVESAVYELEASDETPVFAIAGLDYRFASDWVVVAEWYYQSAGASRESELPVFLADPAIPFTLKQQQARNVLGLAVEKELTPLWRGSYLLLTSALEDEDSDVHASFLHQLNLHYSVSNESELLLSLATGGGKGLNSTGLPSSEFGPIPASLTLRWQVYF